MKSLLASSATLIAAIFTILNSGWNRLFGGNAEIVYQLIVAVLIFALVVLILHNWTDYFKTRPKTYKVGDPRIQEFMQTWIKGSGRCLILSRDLSWVKKQEYATLESKAKSRELEIILQSHTPESIKLQELGADVKEYESLNFIPRSRFTIIHRGAAGERIAVGRARGGKHLITTHEGLEDDVFVLASDLCELLRASCR